jgi:hypothetical protein
LRLTTTIFSYLTALLAGFLIAWYLFPRVELVPVPIDPMTGRPLAGYGMDVPQGKPEAQPPANQNGDAANHSAAPQAGGNKESHVQSK